ncbi:hypothetical protein [Mastigocladopsis repens]|uniref:hypothetical protein n=1 Tax=Mastigocladopsis repens TaxID=221287 RepID=UPI00030827C4|nr:hypothetical protein [Mastigocladopsis repens]
MACDWRGSIPSASSPTRLTLEQSQLFKANSSSPTENRFVNKAGNKAGFVLNRDAKPEAFVDNFVIRMKTPGFQILAL